MAFPADLFAQLAAQAAAILALHGYRQQQFLLNDSFGSHHVTYKNSDARITIVWDGKEEWVCITRQITTSHTAPEELFFRSLKAAESGRFQQEVHNALALLQNYSSSHAHDDDDASHCCSCTHHHH